MSDQLPLMHPCQPRKNVLQAYPVAGRGADLNHSADNPQQRCRRVRLQRRWGCTAADADAARGFGGRLQQLQKLRCRSVAVLEDVHIRTVSLELL